MEKTNVMRLLDAAKIEYKTCEYNQEITDGKQVANLIGEDENCVFKTLVTVGGNRENFVFVIPVNATLNLKKAAKVSSEKYIEMLKQKELLSLTGYVHGGCSPIGMKKSFKTFIDETAVLFDYICVSAGKRGKQIKLNPNELLKFVDARYADLID